MPQPRTATVVPPGSSAPRCASASIPRARPLTIASPAAASSHDRNRLSQQNLGTGGAAEEEAGRRIVDRTQERRELRGGSRQEAVAGRGKLFEVRPLVEAAIEGTPALAGRGPHEMSPGLG